LLTTDAKERALELACQAYSELFKAGIPEHFIPLISSVGEANANTFFGSFGGESCFFLEIENVRSSLSPVKITFGVRYHKRSLWSKFRDILRTNWSKIKNEEEKYEIYLEPDDVTRLKDILRVL